MAAIGALFVEIGAKTTRTEDLQKAQDLLKTFGEKATRPNETERDATQKES